MRVVVTGASGLLGRRVYTALKGCHAISAVFGTCFSRKDSGLISVDLTDDAQLLCLFDTHAPDVIVHCAAERKPDCVEKKTAEAEALNVGATENICRLARSRGAWVLYLSTDYVFDGSNPPYAVDAKPNPLNTYGKLKLAGEQSTLVCNDANAVLRVPILYGPVEDSSESAVTVLWNAVRGNKTCKMDDRQRRYPTHTDCVADVIRQMVHKHIVQKGSVFGIYHFSEPVMMTKYDMAVVMAKSMEMPTTDYIQADTSEPPPDATPRPFDCQLDTSRLTQEGFQLKTLDFCASIKEILMSLSKS